MIICIIKGAILLFLSVYVFCVFLMLLVVAYEWWINRRNDKDCGSPSSSSKKDKHISSSLDRYLVLCMEMLNKNAIKVNKHFFHLVEPSPWPFFVAFSGSLFLFSVILYLNHFDFTLFRSHTFFYLLMFFVLYWCYDIIIESTVFHTEKVQTGLRLGVFWFIVSEVFFFFSIFWSFYHFSKNPNLFTGFVWPPVGISVLDTWGIPTLNTYILVTSGFWLALSHRFLLSKLTILHSFLALLAVFGYGFFFTILQYMEYSSLATFSMQSGVFGSIFYFGTGFHGFHVLIGACFLLMCAARIPSGSLDGENHISFEGGSFYWHFVDIVWLFLFFAFYWWGS